MNLSALAKKFLAHDPVAAGQGDDTSDAIDCESMDRVLFELVTGTNTDLGKITMKITECASSGGTYADVAEKEFETGGKNSTIYQLDAPITKRYVKTEYDLTTQDTQVACGIVSVYYGKKIPTDIGSAANRINGREIK